MAVSFKELYDAQVRSLPGGLMGLGTANQNLGNAYTGALADYERLNKPYAATTAGGTLGTPTTLRSAAAPRPSIGSVAIKGYGKSPLTTTTPASPAAPMDIADPPMPVYDTGRVESLAQRFAAPGIRSLRSATQDVQQGVYENPNVKRMTVRDALAGYGQGLESVMAGALKEGANVYGQEYAPQVSAALQGRSIASSERIQQKGITSSEAMQQRSIASNEAIQNTSIASNERLAQYNNEWRAYLAGL